MIDEVYEEFLAKVAEGRDLPLRKVRQVANGRIWTGEDAYRLGLVDHLGGLKDAIEHAKTLAQLPQDAPVRTVSSKKSFLSALKSKLQQEVVCTLGIGWLFANYQSFATLSTLNGK